MAIQPICDSCQEELTDYGAILLSPPDSSKQVIKLHLCQACYHKIIKEYDIVI